ncbi:MAG: MoxR family ATPase [Acidimicrobiales bacterium]
MSLIQEPRTPPALASIPSLLVDTVETVLLGKRRQVELAVAALLAGSHLLIEDEPGVGKTLLANSIARVVDGRFGRIQGAPDLMPSDIVGVNTYDVETGTWTFHRGPIFNSVVLIDELNRTTPRAQSALLESMAERQVTVDGTTYGLPQPFFVVATQNPADHAGTFALVEGQRDRFDVAISLGLPSRDVERQLLMGSGGTIAATHLEPVASAAEIDQTRAAIANFHVAEVVVEYVLDLVAAVRNQDDQRQVLSTRATQSMVAVARAMAAIRGRNYVVPEDLADIAPAVLAHRARPDGSLAEGAAWVREVIVAVPAPVPVQ